MKLIRNIFQILALLLLSSCNNGVYKLSDFGIKEDCADRLAYLCTFQKTRTIKSYITLDYQVIKEIFESCK